MHQWLRGVPGPMVMEAKGHEVVQFIDSVLEAAQKEPKMAHMKLQISFRIYYMFYKMSSIHESI